MKRIKRERRERAKRDMRQAQTSQEQDLQQISGEKGGKEARSWNLMLWDCSKHKNGVLPGTWRGGRLA